MSRIEEGAEAYIELADEFAAAGKFGSAADNYELALRFEPGSLLALCGLTRVQLRSGDVDEARSTLARARSLDEGHPKVMKLVGEIHANSGRFDKAVDEIFEASQRSGFRGRRGR